MENKECLKPPTSYILAFSDICSDDLSNILSCDLAYWSYFNIDLTGILSDIYSDMLPSGNLT
jgi:hypothetical protein